MHRWRKSILDTDTVSTTCDDTHTFSPTTAICRGVEVDSVQK